MKFSSLLTLAALTASHAISAFAEELFTGNFLLSNLYVEASPVSYGSINDSSYIYFDFRDQDTLDLPPTPCLVFWPKTGPPSTGDSLCANSTFTVKVPDETFLGAINFEIELSHTYLDPTIGEYPYNVLTKFGGLNLTYPGTSNYECELVKGRCWSKTGSSFLAMVTVAIG